MNTLTTLVLALALPSAALASEPGAPSNVTAKKVAGGVLLGISSAAAVAATVLGPVAILSYAGCDSCSDNDNRRTDAVWNASIGLAVTAAVTAAIGIPLVTSARNSERSLRFGMAPTSGGAAMSLAVRF